MSGTCWMAGWQMVVLFGDDADDVSDTETWSSPWSFLATTSRTGHRSRILQSKTELRSDISVFLCRFESDPFLVYRSVAVTKHTRHEFKTYNEIS